MSSSTLHHAERVEQPLATAMLLALDEIAITAQAGKPSRDRCGTAQVFPITAIQVLSGRDQIRYMRLLRGIARAVGVPPFGSVTALLSNVYVAARALNIEMHRSFGGHGQGANVWLPDLSQLQDLAIHINMRAGAPTVNRAMSPITPAHQQRRARGGRPSTDTLKGSALPPLTDPPHCVSAGCPCTATYNGEPGEHCCLTCRRGKPCEANYHQHPTRPTTGGVPHCATAGCPCPSTWNGQPGEACCRTCQRGKPCAQPYHPSRMIPGQPHGQWPHPPVLPDEDNMDTAGEEPQGAVPFTIDLSTEADDDEGDLYELYGAQIPPPYAQYETYGQQQPVSTPLVAINHSHCGSPGGGHNHHICHMGYIAGTPTIYGPLLGTIKSRR